MGRRPRVSRDQVLRAAREAFAERGFDGTTLAAIGSRLDLSPAALLRHAPTKEALFRDAMATGEAEGALPSDFLAEVPAREDPARALRRLAMTLVPFIERKMGESIAHFLRASTEEEARTVRLPFDPRKKSSPPARVVAALEEYFRRARAAGRLRLRDPRAGALSFVGALQSYVFLHRVLRISPPIPLPRYLDTLLEIWARGAFSPRRRRR
ncbi:MAG: TetR/AcrR family transcriptional regulator [Thermoanaerobaculia bacterium]